MAGRKSRRDVYAAFAVQGLTTFQIMEVMQVAESTVRNAAVRYGLTFTHEVRRPRLSSAELAKRAADKARAKKRRQKLREAKRQAAKKNKPLSKRAAELAALTPAQLLDLKTFVENGMSKKYALAQILAPKVKISFKLEKKDGNNENN